LFWNLRPLFVFQLAPYAGMPAVHETLQVYRDVLKERGGWPIK